MTKLLIIIIIVFSGFIIFNIFDNKSEDKIVVDNKIKEEVVEDKYIGKSDDQARVTVDVIPAILGKDEIKNIFEVSFSTHSVEMDYDFSKVIVLKDNLGNSYNSLEWTGGRGGHHVSGDIVFPAIDSQAKNVEINIKGVGGVDRNFKWDLL